MVGEMRRNNRWRGRERILKFKNNGFYFAEAEKKLTTIEREK